jgi:hypothetical protein
MTTEERLAIQTVLVEQLQAEAREHPTLLVDALLAGDGWALVYRVMSQQEAHARQRAETLRHLLGAMAAEGRREGPPGPAPPTPRPPVGGSEPSMGQGE